jgi:trehalose 6-phosphate phosphatase
MAPLLVDPSSSAILSDFDGTLAAIVEDPAAAVPLPGVVEALVDLAGQFGQVAVVSGRPASFLAETLVGGHGAPLTSLEGVRLVGLYGLEWSTDGEIATAPEAEPWRSVVAGVVASLRSAAPDGVWIEAKGLSVTAHWRRAPGEAGWVAGAVGEQASQTGLVPHPGRMTLELRPPLEVDKGTVVQDLVTGFRSACFFGDDLGDVPAFEALGRMTRDRGLVSVAVAVTGAECPPEVRAAADVSVEGPDEAVAALRWLADQAPGGRTLNRQR